MILVMKVSDDIYLRACSVVGFPGGANGKEPPVNAGDT